jgi:hypothetical protein
VDNWIYILPYPRALVFSGFLLSRLVSESVKRAAYENPFCDYDFCVQTGCTGSLNT